MNRRSAADCRVTQSQTRRSAPSPVSTSANAAWARVTLRDAGTLVDRRAHERVPEPDLLLSDIDEPNGHRRCQVAHGERLADHDRSGIRRLEQRAFSRSPVAVEGQGTRTQGLGELTVGPE